MQKVVWLLILALAVLHQDNWFWEDTRLVFGFMPIGLFYHACISMAAAGAWFLATTSPPPAPRSPLPDPSPSAPRPAPPAP